MNTPTFRLGLVAAAILPIIGVSAAESPSTENDDIDTITVVSSRIQQSTNELTTSVVTLDEADIEARYQHSIAETLRTVSGINVSNAGGLGKNTVVRIRGEEGYRSKLYLDGVELSDPTAPQIGPIFDDILNTDFNRIDILKGTQGFAYGADAGGVIQLTSPSVEDGWQGKIRTELGRYDTKRLQSSLAFGKNDSNVFISGQRLESNGFNAQTSDTSGEQDGYNNTTLHISADIKLNENVRLKAVHRDTDGEVDYDGCFDNTTFAQINNCETESEYQTQRVELSFSGSDSTHSIAYTNTDVSRTFINNDEFGFQNDGKISLATYIGASELGEYQLVYGAEQKEETDRINSNERDQHSLFVELIGNFSDNWSFATGYRYDDNDTFGSFNSYRISTGYQFPSFKERQLKLKANYGTGFRAPSLFEQAYNDGPFAFGEAAGLQLSQEESEGFDVGLSFLLSENTDFAITYFHQEVENEIIFDLVGFQGYFQAAGTSESTGIELDISSKISESANIWANYTYNDTEDRNGQQRLRRPEHIYNLGLQLSLLDDRLSTSIFAHGENGAVDVAGIELDDYITVNANIRWQYRDYIGLTVRGSNLLNKDYEEVVGFNTAGAAVSVGIEISY